MTQASNTRGWDFFISYTAADRRWAEWIAVTLENHGYSTFVQAFDIRPGSDFVHQIQLASGAAERTVAVLSPAYLASSFGEAEWRAAFAKDPTGERRLLVPVLVEPCNPSGMLGTRVYVDLTGADEECARAELLAAVDPDWRRPTSVPYPRSRGTAADSAEAASTPFPGDGQPVSRRHRLKGAPRDDIHRSIMTATFVVLTTVMLLVMLSSSGPQTLQPPRSSPSQAPSPNISISPSGRDATTDGGFEKPPWG